MSHFKRLLRRKITNEGTNSSELLEASKEACTVKSVLQHFGQTADLEHVQLEHADLHLLYFEYLINEYQFEQRVMNPILQIERDKTAVHEVFDSSIYKLCHHTSEVAEKILEGYVAIFVDDVPYVVNVFGPVVRGLEKSETETVIVGSHEAFNESLNTNLSLVRRRIKNRNLQVYKIAVGTDSKTDILILYIKDLANETIVNELKKRVRSVESDFITDSNMFVQLIDDFPYSPFPQFLTTERPEVVTNKLNSGKVVGFVEGSPTSFIAPTNFFEFFRSPDDDSQRWALGTVTIFLRYLAFVITLTFTAFYVAVTTFHYEVLPERLLFNLSQSRSQVPFPPVLEAFLMELTIELLREAGARLPAKIGQTIGIVGGIVIGQAAVEAGLVSNTLIIAVAISAIASFVMPNYLLSAGLRLARFGLILFAGILGNLGIMIGVAILIIHLSKLTNLGSSYLYPVAPQYFREWKTHLIRAPFSKAMRRPKSNS